MQNTTDVSGSCLTTAVSDDEDVELADLGTERAYRVIVDGRDGPVHPAQPHGETVLGYVNRRWLSHTKIVYTTKKFVKASFSVSSVVARVVR